MMIEAVKILVVDDEPRICFFLQELLEHDGHQVVAVESGEAALEQIAIQEFDLALLDLKMPEIGGMEVLAALREQCPNTAVIMLTAHASLETAVKALRQGAHDYLFKPCKTVNLRESVRTGLIKRRRELRQRRLLTQLEHSLASNLEEIRATVVEQPAALDPPLPEPPAAQARFLQKGDLIVDFMRHVITLDGRLLELSPTEFDLLAYLATEAPRVIAAQELAREVQGYQSERWEARETVRYHVYRIRQKIKATGARSGVIKTVRGVGYTMREAPAQPASRERVSEVMLAS